MDAIEIQNDLDENRKSVAFDSYDITIRQLVDMTSESQIDIAPEYQRHFVWDAQRQSQLIESLFLGIPVPSLFMATNKDSTWETVDGVQRLTTIINFVGNDEVIKRVNPDCQKLRINGLEKLKSLNGLTYDQLPKSHQLLFMTRPMRVTVLNDRSDLAVRYDLFERLNTGGVTLHPQEIRNCVFIGKFNDMINELAENVDFRKVVKLSKNAEKTGNYEELVLKFFAYLYNREKFSHGVKEFLNEYMDQRSKSFRKAAQYERVFCDTFRCLSGTLPNGIVRSSRKNTTPLILFEAISVGVAEVLENGLDVNRKKLQRLLDDSELKALTTGGTNSKRMVKGRIQYVIDALT